MSGRGVRRGALGGGAAVAVLALAVAAVQQQDRAAGPATSTRAQDAVAAGVPAATPGDAGEAPSTPGAFRVVTADGGAVTVPGKATVLFFLTSEGCGACLEEAAVLNRLAARWGDRVSVVGVEMVPGTPPAYLEAFSTAAGGLSFPLAVDDGALLRRFSVQTLDTTIVLDATGRQVFRDNVPSTAATLTRAVERAGVRS